MVAIVGAPNAGKSTLFNRLVDKGSGLAGFKPRALVSPMAGTTRDRLESTAVMEGRSVRLIDTGGVEQLNEALASVVAAEGDRRPMERLVEEQGEGARASVASALKNAWHLFFLTKRVRGTHTRSLRQHCA